MGLFYIVILVAFSVIANVNGSTSSSISSNSPTFVAENQANLTSVQYLGTGSAEGGKNEERLPQLPISAWENVKSLFTPATISKELFERWLKDKTSADKVFIRLQLVTTEDNLLEQPHLITWIKYANALNFETRGKSGSAVSKLTKYYGNVAVTGMIDAAKKKPNMKEIASDLQTQQFRYWYYRDDMNTPDSVYTALHLGIKSRMAIDDLLGDTLFLTWINYVKFFDENTKKQQAGYLSKLKSWYDDEGITVLVNSAKSRPNTLEFASTLRREQIERWLSNGKSPVDVWKILKHGVIGDNVLASPEFRILFTYVNRFNNAYPNKKTTVVTALRDADHSGPLNAILGAIKSNKPGTEYIAKQMEAAFFKTLLRKYDPKQVFKMFQLHLSPEWFFERPLLPIWVKYTNVFNSKNPDKKTTMVTILRTQFGDATLYKMLVKGKKVRGRKALVLKLEHDFLTRLEAEGKTVGVPARVT